MMKPPPRLEASQSTAHSPTISNMNVSESQVRGYVSLRDAVDSYQSSKQHYRELNQYLVLYLSKQATSEPGYRAGARRRLPRLTAHQFHELSSDCYEELLRRSRATAHRRVGTGVAYALGDAMLPSALPVREDMHPRRNGARQKLAALSPERFQDLLGDVHYELGRRYPEFKEA